MPFMLVTKTEKQFLLTLMNNQFGEKQMRQIINDPSQINHVSNLSISKKVMQQSPSWGGDASEKMTVESYGLSSDLDDDGSQIDDSPTPRPERWPKSVFDDDGIGLPKFGE